MIYRKIDENGLFIEDVILSEPPILTDDNGNTISDPHYINETVPQGFYHPRWNGSEWIEGLTDEEIAEITKPSVQEPTETDYLMLAMAELDMQRALDKTETELAITELAEIVLGGM